MNRIKCPICTGADCSELIVDLLVCNTCNHIFKKEPYDSGEILFSQLHLYTDPVKELCEVIDLESNENTFEFSFPSMILFGLEIYPGRFYKSKYNHYFNQMSLVTLLDRCGLKIIEQTNRWDGPMCETRIICKKEELI